MRSAPKEEHSFCHFPQLFPQSVPVGLPESWKVVQAVGVAEGQGSQGGQEVAGHAHKAAEVTYAPGFPVMVVQIGRVAYLVEAFPFFLPVTFRPIVVREEPLFVHQGIGHIQYFIAGA